MRDREEQLGRKHQTRMVSHSCNIVMVDMVIADDIPLMYYSYGLYSYGQGHLLMCHSYGLYSYGQRHVLMRYTYGKLHLLMQPWRSLGVPEHTMGMRVHMFMHMLAIQGIVNPTPDPY